jgi:hypothetical protein
LSAFQKASRNASVIARITRAERVAVEKAAKTAVKTIKVLAKPRKVAAKRITSKRKTTEIEVVEIEAVGLIK